jgi:hypothetical protein
MGAAEQAAVRDRVCGCVMRRGREAFASGLRSLVLTGSMARNEATIRIASTKQGATENRELRTENSLKVLGDADFILIFRDSCALPHGSAIARLTAACEADLRAAGIDLHLSIKAAHGAYFQKLPPHIFSYELRAGGLVIWGDQDVLETIPRFDPAAISLEDAWRMLSNRMTEWLEFAPLVFGLQPKAVAGSRLLTVRGTGHGQRDTSLQGVHYATVKFYLDMATSLLVFLQAYEPSYCARAKRLQRLAVNLSTHCAPPSQDGPGVSTAGLSGSAQNGCALGIPHADRHEWHHDEVKANQRRSDGSAADLPFPLADFAQRVMECTEWKVGCSVGNSDLLPVAVADWQVVTSYACRLWVWQLARLANVARTRAVCPQPGGVGTGNLRWETGASVDPGMAKSLFDALATQQTLFQKFRGWLYVARRTNWLRSVTLWPRWLRMVWRCTPRYCVYDAAFQLVTQLPGLLDEDGQTARAAAVSVKKLLPVYVGNPEAPHGEWQDLVKQVVWNYEYFVSGTRA